MDTRKVAAVYLCLLAVLGGAALVGGPVLVEIVAAANQAEIEVESVDLSDSEIETGESVEVIATVENDGDVAGNYTVTLAADGQTRESKTVQVGADSTRTVTFEETFQEAGTYQITVNGQEGGVLDVLEPGELVIGSASRYDTTITTEQSLEYFASVTNVGDKGGSFTVELTADGRTVDDQQVELSGGQSQSLQLLFAPEQVGTYDMRVETDDDEYNSGVVEVVQPAEPKFEVVDASLSDERILTGERTTVTADVRNVGNAAGSFVATLSVDGEDIAGQRVRLDAGEATTVRFRPAFQSAGEYDVAVEDAEAGTVTVQEPADIAVVDAEAQSDTVTRGETLFVEATVENRGDVRGQTTVTLEVDGRPVTSIDVAIGGDSQSRVELTHEFSETGEKQVSVNGVDAGTVTVLTPAQFELSDASLSDDRILVGERLSITARVENTGDVEGVFTADLIIDGETVLSKPYQIDGGESGAIGFERQFDEPGEYTIHINEARAGTVTVLEPADLSVTSADTGRSEVTTGETVSIDATVENRGGLTGETSVALSIDGSVVEERTVELAGGASTTVEFTYQFEERGEYSVAVNDESAGQVTVLAPADLSVTRADTGSDQITTDETLSVQATVANTGDVTGETSVDLRIDGSVVDTKQVSVDGRDAEQVEFNHEFETTGDRPVAVNSVSAGEVSVLAPANFELTGTVLSEDSVLTGQTVQITAEVRNTGDVEGSYEAALRVDGDPVQSKSLTLGGGESGELIFERTFETADEYSLGVGGESAGTLTVLAPADLSVVDAETEATQVTTEERISVDALVENAGDVAGETEVALEVNGNTVASETVSVEGADQTRVNFTHRFTETGEKQVSVNGQDAGEIVAVEPASFDVSDGSVARAQIVAGESVTVTADVENRGGVEATFDATLRINGEAVEVRLLTLGPGESGEVRFRPTFESAGSYDIRVSGVRAGQVTVDQPATFRVTETTLTEREILENSTIRITSEVTNIGDRDGRTTVELQVGTQVVGEQTVDIEAGQSTDVSFEHRFTSPGDYEVRIGDAAAGTVRVDQPATLAVTDASINTTEALRGNPVEITARVANSGDRSGTYEATLMVEGDTVDSQSITVPPEGNDSVRIVHAFEAVGNQTVSVGNVTAGTVAVTEPPEFDVERAVVPADWAVEGEQAVVRTVVENPSEWTVTRTINVTVDEREVAAKSVRLEPGEQREVEIQFQASNGTVKVDGVEAGQIDSSQLYEETGAAAQPDSGGIDSYPILSMVAVLGVIIVGWFVLSFLGIINWRD